MIFELDELKQKYKKRILNRLLKKHTIPEFDKIYDQASINLYSSNINIYYVKGVPLPAEIKEKITTEQRNNFKTIKTILATDDSRFFDFISFFMRVTNILLLQTYGDTIGYNNGTWEFNEGRTNVGPEYSYELFSKYIHLGGINDFSLHGLRASDDTIMFRDVFEVLCRRPKNMNEFGDLLQEYFLKSFDELKNRHIGGTTKRSLEMLDTVGWKNMPYSSMDIGSGACMRTGAIGIMFPGIHNRKKLIYMAVEASRITHNSATAILGGVASALFMAYGIEGIPVEHWPYYMLKIVKGDYVSDYIKKTRPNDYDKFMRDKSQFIQQWEKYHRFRFDGLKAKQTPRMMQNISERIKYLADNFSKNRKDFPGGCGDDATIIAYDSLLEGGKSLEKVIVYSALHYGDSDTTASMALSWYGAAYANSYIIDKKILNQFKELEFVEYYEKMFYLNTDFIKKIIKVYYYDMMRSSIMTGPAYLNAYKIFKNV